MIEPQPSSPLASTPAVSSDTDETTDIHPMQSSTLRPNRETPDRTIPCQILRQVGDGGFGVVYSRAGDSENANEMLRAWDDQAKRRYLSPGPRLLLHLCLGEKDKALDWLKKCYAEQDEYCWGLKIYPLFDPLRTEPRFQTLLKKVDLDQ